MSKEVLMSRRSVAMDTVDAARHSGGYQQQAPPPISNYKGVMLCDRPNTLKNNLTGGRSGDGEGMPFTNMVGPGSRFEALGLNPSREQRAAKLAEDNRTSKKDRDDFLSRHKRWLHDLKKMKKERQELTEQQIKEAVDKTQRFREYAAKMRANIRASRKEPADAGGGGGSGGSSRKGGGGAEEERKRKPAWALTEEGVEEQELDELLKFTNELDFDSYIQDLEVRNALAAVKNRISELAKPREKRGPDVGEESGGGGGDAETSVSGDDWKENFVRGWNQLGEGEGGGEGGPDGRLGTARSDSSARSRLSTARSERSRRSGDEGGDEGGEDGGDVTRDVAEQVLQQSRSMRRIHSSRSIRNILAKKQQKAGGALGAIGEEEEVDVGPTQPPPVLAVHHANDDGGGRPNVAGARARLDPSNLPYLHRNPAV